MAKVIFAIPSKGRLKTQCEEYLAGLGLKVRQKGGERGYEAYFEGIDDIDLRLLSASEIARGLILGEIDYGITGEDLLRESCDNLEEIAKIHNYLGFGKADVVVAVPNGWIDVQNMADLQEVSAILRANQGVRLRVATKFARLTQSFFNQHHINDYRIIHSGGATEGAPANGISEIIVDITTSGATLSANNLKIIGDGLILSSQAVLAQNLARAKKAPKSKMSEIFK